MKRILTIIVTLSLLISLTVLDAVYVSSVFTDINDNAVAILESMDENKEEINSEENIKAAETLLKKWDNTKETVLLLIPHAQAAIFTDKIASLLAYIRQNDYNMANACAVLLASSCEAILNQNLPHLHNII